MAWQIPASGDETGDGNAGDNAEKTLKVGWIHAETNLVAPGNSCRCRLRQASPRFYAQFA